MISVMWSQIFSEFCKLAFLLSRVCFCFLRDLVCWIFMLSISLPNDSGWLGVGWWALLHCWNAGSHCLLKTTSLLWMTYCTSSVYMSDVSTQYAMMTFVWWSSLQGLFGAITFCCKHHGLYSKMFVLDKMSPQLKVNIQLTKQLTREPNKNIIISLSSVFPSLKLQSCMHLLGSDPHTIQVELACIRMSYTELICLQYLCHPLRF